jgi:aerobic carbon-monoxide dehydrogenase small subunit
MKIVLTINNKKHSVEIEPEELLLDVLRSRFNYKGAKYGCGIGECGACTVIMNGKPVLSCQMLAAAADGQDIQTIEGLADGSSLHPMQQAFIDEGAVQCGFCTPGMVLTAKALVDEIPDPTEDEIKNALRGNLCRCTGYENILQAVTTGAKKMRDN